MMEKGVADYLQHSVQYQKSRSSHIFSSDKVKATVSLSSSIKEKRKRITGSFGAKFYLTSSNWSQDSERRDLFPYEPKGTRSKYLVMRSLEHKVRKSKLLFENYTI